MEITLFTSGSTKESKKIKHDNMLLHIKRSINEIGLTSSDIVLDIFPANVIAHYTITAQPAIHAGAHLITANFDPYNYVNLFNEFRPTFISLIPRHIEILEKTKGWESLDMSCVRYMVTGSQLVSQSLVDLLRKKGVKVVANWYGMTEMPPPVLIGYNSESFDFTPKEGYVVDFTDEGECVVNDMPTGDIFDLSTKKFIKRKLSPDGKTWKTNV
jgi:acyl-coenzyme A synthetase/AMP-(fatty) acid ligase